MGMKSQEFKETLENFCKTDLKWILKSGPAPQSQRERKLRALMRTVK